jgi:hypothetical protein
MGFWLFSSPEAMRANPFCSKSDGLPNESTAYAPVRSIEFGLIWVCFSTHLQIPLVRLRFALRVISCGSVHAVFSGYGLIHCFAPERPAVKLTWWMSRFCWLVAPRPLLKKQALWSLLRVFQTGARRMLKQVAAATAYRRATGMFSWLQSTC